MKNVSELYSNISTALADINDVMLSEMPDNSQQLIGAKNTRNAGNAVADKISTPFGERLTCKVEMRIVEGYEIVPSTRTNKQFDLSDNTDKIQYTGNSGDKLFIVKLPWNSTVYFRNDWDNDEYMSMCIVNDNGNMFVPTGQEDIILYPFTFFDSYDNNKPFQYRAQDGRQTEIDFAEVFVPNAFGINNPEFLDNYHMYIISQFGEDNLSQPTYLPYLSVNDEVIIGDAVAIDQFDTTAVVDKKNLDSSKTYMIEQCIHNFNLSNVVKLLNQTNEYSELDAKITDSGIEEDSDSQISWMTINPGDLVNAVNFKGNVTVSTVVPDYNSYLEPVEIKKSGYDWITGNNEYTSDPSGFISFPDSNNSVTFFNNTGSILYLVWPNKLDDITIGNPDYIEINGSNVFENDEWTGNIDLNANINNWIKEIQYNREQMNYLADQVQQIWAAIQQ